MRKRRKFRFTVTGKLLSIVVISIGVVITASGFGIHQLQKIGQEIQFIAEAEVPLTEAIGHVTTHRLEQTVLIEQLARVSLLQRLGNSSLDDESIIHMERRILALGNTITQELTEAQEIARKGIAMARTEKLAMEFASVLSVLEATSQEHASYTLATNQALAHARYDNALTTDRLLQDIGEEHSTFNMELEELLFRVQALTERAARTATEHEQNAIRFTVLISLGAAIFAIILATWLGRQAIAFPLLEVVSALRCLSRNDFDVELPITRNDEIGDIGRAYEAFKKHLIKVQEQEEAEKLRQSILTREIRLLSELNEWLQSSGSLDELFGLISHFMTKLLPDCAGSVYIYSNSRDVLDGACAWNGGTLEAHIRPTSCWGLRRGRPYVFGEGEVSFSCEHIGLNEGEHVYLCLPILAHGETVGLMHLSPAADAGEEDFLKQRRLAQMAAEQISLAIANTRMRDELHNQSVRDPLTGLYNRRHFIDSLRSCLERSQRINQPVSLVSIDVDHFKKFNDNHGHDAGDMVLRSVGSVLEQACEGEERPCRIGGEEFMVLLPASSPTEAACIAEKLREAIEKIVVRYGDKNLPKVTVSCGVAGYPDHGRLPQDLMKSADDALYKSKDEGRNRVSIASGHPEEEDSDFCSMLEDSINEPYGKLDEDTSKMTSEGAA